MADQVMGRRRVLQGVGVVTGGAVVAGLALADPVHADGGKGGRVEGGWTIVRHDDGDPNDIVGVFGFASGGVVVYHDIFPDGPPQSGSWASDGNRFTATFWSGFPANRVLKNL